MTALQETTGRWWAPGGFVTGICRHDSRVHAIDALPSATPGPLSTFLPAPVDLHIHGGGGFDCMAGDDALRGMLRAHAVHGTGALLATSVTAPFSDIADFTHSVARVMADPDSRSARLLGAHLEGPFISPKKLGAQPAFACPVNVDQAESWFDTGVVRLITYAPEVDQHGDLLALCQRYGVKMQIGHTLCTSQQARRALESGSGVTHLYNAMSCFSNRGDGVATAALAYAQYAEIITDGQHVERAAFEVARRSIPGLFSITDATAAAGMPDGNYRLGSHSVRKTGEKVVLRDGRLAGSCLTQRRSMAVLRSWGVEWHDIGSLVSATPARWIEETSVGRIATGTLAHWIEIQDDQPVALWLAGERIAW